MTERINSGYVPIQWGFYAKAMLIGAAIGLLGISFFVFGVDNPDPAWGPNWMVKPLIVTPVVAAMGGAFFAFLTPMRRQSGWVMALGFVMSIFGFLIALWMGFILGLNGTMWN